MHYKIMSLSNKTIQSLADAMAPEIVEYILEDVRWNQLMKQLISDAISEKMGTLDDNLQEELSYNISERLILISLCHLRNCHI
jgi:hypothetical protein